MTAEAIFDVEKKINFCSFYCKDIECKYSILCGKRGGLSLTSVNVMFTVVVPDNPPIWPPMSLAWMTTWYCSLFSRSMFSKAVLIIPENTKIKEVEFTSKVLTLMEILIRKTSQPKEQNNLCVISKLCPVQIFTVMRWHIKLQTCHIVSQAAAYVTKTILVVCPERSSTYL